LVEAFVRHSPRPRVPTIGRRRLLRLLADEAQAPIVVVSASAGYGKSILAAQWSIECGRPSALLALEGRDNDPIVLLNYLVESVDRLAPCARGLHAELSSAAPRIDEVVLPALARELASLSPIELILDNVQEVSEPSSLAILGFLIEHVPPGSQLMLVSRGDPDLPLASRRLAGELLDVRADRLAFDFDETRALAVRRGTDQSESVLSAVHERAEGWAAGLELALRTMSETASGDGGAVAPGPQREVADYLLETVLEQESEQHRTFLLATSVLRRMSAPLCDAVLGTSGSVNVLRELERSNSFVIPLDEHRGWYRYHQQFAEVLRSELDRQHPGRASVYLARAAEWHERNGSDPEEAFRCAHECGDVARTGRVALACFGRFMAGGDQETFRSWLEECTSGEIASDAQLAIAAAWLYSSLGDSVMAQQYAVAAGRAEMDQPSADGASSIRSSLANLRSVLAYRGIHQMLTDAEYVYAAERETSARWLAESSRTIGVANLLLDRPAEAIAALREALMVATSPGLAATKVLCLDYLTFAGAETGRWLEARKWAREAKALTAECNLAQELPALIAYTGKATVLVHDGDLYRAAQELAQARSLSHLLGGMRWMTADLELRWGNLSLHLGDRLSAREHAGNASAALHGYDDPGNLQSRLAALEERLARASDLQLTPAELRVIPFLPTHLLVKEIAARLHLSTATVKTHLHGIFNKLDVSTRSEAVDRMEQLGLEAARALPAAGR
jgi:LuxR family maltose regulon positive regulatory protein